jgi:ADP-heptose:LPS heptosyltransferase
VSKPPQSLLELPIKRIAIVRSLRGLSDLLCAIPALRALRAAFPDAHITLIGLAKARPLVQRFKDYIDEFLEFPGYPGIPEVSPSVHQLPAFFTQVHSFGYDLALQMHGNGLITNSFSALLGARFNAGFYVPGHFCLDPNYFLPYPDSEPEIWRHLRLMDFLGIPLQGDELEFLLQEIDFLELNQIPEMRYLQQVKYICIHPSSNLSERQWSIEHFAKVGDAIATRGYQVVLTGTIAEANLTEAISQRMQAQAINLAGKTSLGAMAALLIHAELLVCNDIGISHLAVALHVPSVVIFSSSQISRWAPLDRQRHRVLSPEFEVPSSEWIGSLPGRAEQNLLISAKLPVTPAMVMGQIEYLLGQKISIINPNSY